MDIKQFTSSFKSSNISYLEIELILAKILKKSREFILTHPEHNLTKNQEIKAQKLINRRVKLEPLAYILGQKEFYGLPFKVNKNTLIPRPETELLVEKVLKLKPKNKTIIDIGTGSGNIIITLAKNIKEKNNFYGTDISPKALQVAKQNSKLNKVDKKIKFIKGNLLQPFIQNTKYQTQNTIVVANLPYLSKKIYSETMPDVKNFEPKSALYSSEEGLAHYKKLFSQIKILAAKSYKLKATILLEFSPEQKPFLQKIIRQEFPQTKTTFFKDLAQKWRIAKIEI